MFKNLQDVKKFVDENMIEAIDLKFCDLWGRQHHLTVPSSQLSSQLMEQGIGFDGSSIGLKNVKSGDMVMVPDLKTGFQDPFWNVPTLSFLCTALNASDFKIFSNDPRNLARKAESYLLQTGIADQSMWGPELEFYIFDEVYYENANNRAGYELVSYEAESDSDNSPTGSYIHLHGGYHAAPPKDKSYQLRQEIVGYLQKMGVPVKYHHHEVGSYGQVEIETTMMDLLAAGDAVKLIKYTAKMTALRNNQSVTFMPKPIFQEAGSGMHFHQHLFLEGKNLFYDPDGYGNLSELARYYIGGLLLHGPALLALTNPSTNSYRRLVPGYEAPINAFYSLGNRSAAIRIPKYANRPDTTRIEFRPPDATCNPYLALAAQLLAGIDGIQNQIDPSDLGYGPIDDDIFSWTSEQRATIKPLPTSLEEALSSLEKDHDFLRAGDVFSSELVEEWIEHKRDEEIDPVRIRPHPYEISLYFDV
jgi:glutamine synthetase